MAACLVLANGVQAAPSGTAPVLPMEQRAAVIDRWLEDRIHTVLPSIMRRAGIDLWVIVGREYNEDPVLETMLPATWLSARRRTMLVIFDPGGDAELETLAVARYGVGPAFQQAWDPAEEPDQWVRLAQLIDERDPRRIGIDVSADCALADGLSHHEHERLLAALPARLADRVTPAEALAVGWLETRSPAEMVVYRQICRIAHDIIAEGFSQAAIQPGVTTPSDLAWWYRQRVQDLGLDAWFHPSVSVQRRAPDDASTIQPGDLLHVDFGITYLRLNTDTQQHAYVLRSGETSAPEGLQAALATGNRLQDILTGNFVAGRTGNDILAAALTEAAAAGIQASIYTHPIGYHGHAAGPTIGMWDQQSGVPGSGDYPLYPDTAYAIELSARVAVPGWAEPVRIMLEEDAFFDGNEVRYIDGRQTRLHLVPGPR
jgi:Xaa-Pro aminopeptidase